MSRSLLAVSFFSLSAFATQAYICAPQVTEEMDHPQAIVSMIGEDTENDHIEADVKLFLKGQEFQGNLKGRKTDKEYDAGFELETVDAKDCKTKYEFSQYKLPSPGLLCKDCVNKRKDAPMVRVWKLCEQELAKRIVDLPCMHYQD